MQKKQSSIYQPIKIAWVSSILLVICVGIWFKYNIFNVQQTSQSPRKTALEQVRGLDEWALIDISWNVYIWPYSSLREQRYRFVGRPKHLRFWLYSLVFDDAKRFFHELWFNNTTVQWIIESNHFGSNTDHYQESNKHFVANDNIILVPDQRLWVIYQHAKTFLTDSGFIIQTANLSYSSFMKNREIFFFWKDTGVTISLQNLFYNDRMSQRTHSWDLHPNLVVCPINCRDRLESLLQSAQSSIMMYQQYIADERIQHILREKAIAWVDIKIILWDRGKVISWAWMSGNYDWWEQTMQLSDRQDAAFITDMGWAVKLQSSPYVHAKAILIDGMFLLITSMNISETSIDKNREIGILLVNPFQIEKFVNVFMKDWNKKTLSIE